MVDNKKIQSPHGGQRSICGIFAKYWQPGQVKTRLATAIGSESAAALHLIFLRTVLQRFAALQADRTLLCTPSKYLAEFSAVAGSDWNVEPQSEGDLGDRMASFFRNKFDYGYERAVLIGSDTPTLPLAFVERAFELLAAYPVVIGPSDDGGYYLIGAAHDVPPIFHDIAWSTRIVLDQTIRRLDEARIPFAQLPPWYDVDELADLNRLASELQGNRDEALNRLAALVSEVLGIKR